MPLPEDEVVRAANRATDEAACKKKKDAEKAKKEAQEHAKLQRGKRWQGSDEEAEEDDDDDVDEEEEDDIPWDELAHDDEGSSSQLSASAQVPRALHPPRRGRGRMRAWR
jgi:hypothetical protein